MRWVGEQQEAVVGEAGAPRVVVWPEPTAGVLVMGKFVEAWALWEEWEQRAQAERVPWEEVKGEERIWLKVDSALDSRMNPELPSGDKRPFVEGLTLFPQQFL